METEGSLPHSQVPVTCSYPEPANPVHTPTSYFLNIILPSTPESSKWSLSLRFPHLDPVYASTPPTHKLHAPPISFFLILSPKQYLVRSTDHSATQHAASSTPLLPRPS